MAGDEQNGDTFRKLAKELFFNHRKTFETMIPVIAAAPSSEGGQV